MKQNIVLLKNLKMNLLVIHYEKFPIDESCLNEYIEMYSKRGEKYIKHWNNVHSCVKLNESLESNHILIGGGRINFTPDESFDELRENDWFNLSKDAQECDIVLKTDDTYNEEYYVNLITKKIEDTPNLYD
jgi:hypothetical protein